MSQELRTYVQLHRAEGLGDDRKHVAHSALVVRRHGELLSVIFVDPALEYRLNDVNWADAIELVPDVPPQSEAEPGHYFYTDPQQKAAMDMLWLKDTNAELERQLAQTTEGKDAALQALADANARKPSAEDLDAVAADAAAKEATPGNIVPIDTAPAPQPES